MESSLGKSHGTVPGVQAGSLPGKNPGNSSDIGRNDLIKATQGILLQFPIKVAAELQDSTTKAVESQRNGDSAMSLLAAARMCRGSAKARALFAPLFGFTGSHTDPDFMQGMELIAQSYMRQQLAMFGGQPMPMPAAPIEESDRDELTGDLFGGDNGQRH